MGKYNYLVFYLKNTRQTNYIAGIETVCCHKYIAQQPNTMAWATYTKLLVDPHRKSMKL